jgi:hypothetical protein
MDKNKDSRICYQGIIRCNAVVVRTRICNAMPSVVYSLMDARPMPVFHIESVRPHILATHGIHSHEGKTIKDRRLFPSTLCHYRSSSSNLSYEAS